MKHYFLLQLLILFGFLNASSQHLIEWQKCIGGSSIESAYSVITCTDGNIAIVAGSASTDGDLDSIPYSSFWFLKMTPAGDILWSRRYLQTNPGGIIYSITETADHGFVLGGHIFNFPLYWVEVIRLDSLGIILWDTQDFPGQYVRCYSAKETHEGEFVDVGEDVVNPNGAQFRVKKRNASGGEIWTKYYGGSDDDIAKDVIICQDGNYLVTGIAGSNDGDVIGNHSSSEDLWALKLDTAGNIIWSMCHGSIGYDIYSGAAGTFDGGCILLGNVSNNNGDVSGLHGSYDMWVAKIDSLGTLQWQKCIGGSLGESANSIKQLPDGSYLISGTTSSNDGDHPYSTNGYADAWVVSIDSIGNILWSKSFGGEDADEAQSAALTSDGGIVAISSISSALIDVSGNHGGDDLWVVKLDGDYTFNRVAGHAFFDFNSNMTQDGNDIDFKGRVFRETSTGKFQFSDNNGMYLMAPFDSGNISVAPNPVIHFTSMPLQQSHLFSGSSSTDTLGEFVFQPIGLINDLSVTINPLGSFRQNQYAYYELSYKNSGTTVLSPTVTFYLDTNITFDSSSVVPSFMNLDSITWNLGVLHPFETGNILIRVHVDLGLFIGTIINSHVKVEPLTTDATPLDNESWWGVAVTGSFDPNDIHVSRDVIYMDELPQPPYLEYIICFQNIGNDTAFNIRIKNNLPPELDAASIEIVSSSDSMEVSYSSYSRMLEFKFDNILLPYKSIDNLGSNGYVRYKIKPLTTLQASDVIGNLAAVYFDYNYPVLTNIAITEIHLPNQVQSVLKEKQTIKVFPNPASSLLTIFCQFSFSGKIVIRDCLGVMVMEKNIPGSNQIDRVDIDISALSPGIYFVSDENKKFAKFIKM